MKVFPPVFADTVQIIPSDKSHESNGKNLSPLVLFWCLPPCGVMGVAAKTV